MQHSEKLLGRLRNRRRHDQGRRAQNAAPLYEREVTFGLGSQPRNETHGVHSVMMRSAHSTRPTKTAGFPNFAPHGVTSASVTTRARPRARLPNTGMCF